MLAIILYLFVYVLDIIGEVSELGRYKQFKFMTKTRKYFNFGCVILSEELYLIFLKTIYYLFKFYGLFYIILKMALDDACCIWGIFAELFDSASVLLP